MRLRSILASATIACIGFAAPTFAQTAQQDLQQYMKSHPELQQNPSLMNNPTYLSHHQDLAHWLSTHPQVNRGRYGSGMGAWDSNHQWRDADWWHRNNPNWVYQNHPEWNQAHPAWTNDGDYDDQHQWRSRSWWQQNHPDWANQHHPHWKERVEERYREHHHGNAYGNPHDENAYGNPHDQPHGRGNPHDND
jgi:hypothetical protein